MRWSKTFIPTLKEDPADAEVISHKLLVRAGYIRQISRGIYDYLPLALKVLRKIENIVREEMDRAGAQELLLPVTSPAELWKESGRWEVYGKELLRFKDRHDREFCLGPTHEEVITDVVRRVVRSYRELPFNLYQIQTKFRDEVRPRFGLMRGREFIMKDAYSFHADVEDCLREYDKMLQTYKRIFDRCGLRFRPVEADTGAIGGSQSHEFQVLAESGEDAIASCRNCEYAANLQKAQTKGAPPAGRDISKEPPKIEKVATPGKKSVAEVAAFLNLPADRFIKTLVYKIDEKELVAVLGRGDHEINELKLQSVLGCQEVRLADEEEVTAATQVAPGFLGPVGIRLRMVADLSIQGIRGAVTGANEANAHYVEVDQERDFTPSVFADLRLAVAGDACPRCAEGVLEIHRGIEVGQVFYLGKKYSEALGATYLDTEGRERPIEMGCYGIGISRLVAATIEQYHDENGILWPFSIAPFHLLLLPINYLDKQIGEVTETLYQDLLARNVEVLLDDRDERPGVKFKDADLIGVPLRLTIGAKGLARGQVELRWRRDGRTEEIPIDLAADHVQRTIALQSHHRSDDVEIGARPQTQADARAADRSAGR
jgi:prolyl-tRNA synthetase